MFSFLLLMSHRKPQSLGILGKGDAILGGACWLANIQIVQKVSIEAIRPDRDTEGEC